MKAHMSDGHLYAGDKVRKWQYKGYFLVIGDLLDEEVFSKLSDAENYCQRKGYDPDECIKSGDPEVLSRVQEIAGWKAKILEEQADILHSMLQKRYEETERLARVRDKNEAEYKRNLYREMDQENVIKSINIGSGLYEAYKNVSDRAFYYKMLLYVKKP